MCYNTQNYTLPRSRDMSITSQKYRNLWAEPIGQKAVTDLPGIGKVFGGRLEEQGFDMAYVVLGQFLLFRKDEVLFKDWLEDVCKASAKHQKECCDALLGWCNNFL